MHVVVNLEQVMKAALSPSHYGYSIKFFILLTPFFKIMYSRLIMRHLMYFISHDPNVP